MGAGALFCVTAVAATLLPASMPAQVVALPTCTGVVRLVLVPSPTSPLQLLPQHHSVASARTAQVCA